MGLRTPCHKDVREIKVLKVMVGSRGRRETDTASKTAFVANCVAKQATGSQMADPLVPGSMKVPLAKSPDASFSFSESAAGPPSGERKYDRHRDPINSNLMAPLNQNMVVISVRWVNESNIISNVAVTAHLDDTLDDLKAKIQHKLGIPPQKQVLIFKGYTLIEGSLAENDVQDWCSNTIYVVVPDLARGTTPHGCGCCGQERRSIRTCGTAHHPCLNPPGACKGRKAHPQHASGAEGVHTAGETNRRHYRCGCCGQEGRSIRTCGTAQHPCPP
eukprot:gene6046-1082_t